jgi:hypothetical protein
MATDAEKAAYAAQFYKTKETDIETKAYEYAKALGCWHAKFKSSQNRGLPDRIFITPDGVVFFIEFKAPKKTARKLQRLVIDDMLHVKADVFVTNNLDEAKRIIHDMVTFGDA